MRLTIEDVDKENLAYFTTAPRATSGCSGAELQPAALSADHGLSVEPGAGV